VRGCKSVARESYPHVVRVRPDNASHPGYKPDKGSKGDAGAGQAKGPRGGAGAELERMTGIEPA
jgi:hypothetical protein